MRLSDFMHEELILLNLLSDKKGIATSEKTLIKAVLNREALGSTAIGNGVAIPHAKNPCVKEKAIVFGRAQKGKDFDSIDGKPVTLFFMIVSHTGETGAHLKMLARISRLLQKF